MPDDNEQFNDVQIQARIQIAIRKMSKQCGYAIDDTLAMHMARAAMVVYKASRDWQQAQEE